MKFIFNPLGPPFDIINNDIAVELGYISIPQMLRINNDGSYTIESGGGTRVYQPSAGFGKGMSVYKSITAKADGSLVIESGSSATALGA